MLPPPLPVFTYGTLRVAEVWRAVTGLATEPTPAVARGWVARPVEGEAYPGLAESSEHEALGSLYPAIDELTLARLDRFEGEAYERRAIEVLIGDSTTQAWAYVYPPQRRSELRDEVWSLDEFLASGALDHFRRRYAGFFRFDDPGAP